MNSKAQGLSLNTIVIGAIVLIVLVVLIGIFTGYFSNFTPDFVRSTEKVCPSEQIKSECDYSREKPIVGKFNPPLPEGSVCCVLTENARKADALEAECKDSCEAVSNECNDVCSGITDFIEMLDCEDGCSSDRQACLNAC